MTTLSYADYLAAEASSPVKHEFLRGVVWAMAGGTIEHGRLQAALVAALATALRGKPCVVLTSDVRVRVEATDRTTYPDVTVVCGKREVSPVDPNAVTNPTMLVEVLSEGTERADRGEKFAHYRHLSSLREYVLVNTHERRIEVFRRSDASWTFTEATEGALRLTSLDVTLDVDAIYFDPTG